MEFQFKDIQIRTDLKAGDLAYIIYLHSLIYRREYSYGLAFEAYVAEGIAEFYRRYDAKRDCVWVCEHQGTMIGFLLLMARGDNTAQLRYFMIAPEFRGLGLGKKLLELYLSWLKDKGYQSAYLWTTHEQETAAALYTKFGFKLTEAHESSAFGKLLTEQRYDLVV